ncbi:type VI secretion system-associated protein TagF [Pelagibius sp. Alg239-R121]|uniref:type VI secretion system-associated protein TagF n=1 Tax=Pelagibius sp. Alg239-R121 TaxID=2993448 RepID=UPI0024A705E7|nr:type VI secretion system-associated protein TagF [Pelagibius sp. Alg239-R121]
MSDDNAVTPDNGEVLRHQDEEPGFYGKLPSKGDFVTRRLSQKFVEAWDTWLQNGLQTSRDRLGEDWLSIYMTSPIWRFALARGVGGQDVMTGVLMPSVDRVGRYFPLTLAVAVEGCENVAGLPKHGAGWYAEAEDAVLAALDDDSEFEDVDSRIQALGVPEFNEGTAPEMEQGAGECGLRFAVDPSDGFAPDYTGLIGHFIGQLYPRYCLWWTAGSERVVPSMLVSSGLPSMGAFVAFLDGQWRDSGWTGGQNGLADDGLDGII